MTRETGWKIYGYGMPGGGEGSGLFFWDNL